MILTIGILNDAGFIALKALHKKKQIGILSDIDLDRPALPGPPMSKKAFRKWIAEREKGPAISWKEAEKILAKDLKQIQRLIQ
jgi:hypothetical protein